MVLHLILSVPPLPLSLFFFAAREGRNRARQKISPHCDIFSGLFSRFPHPFTMRLLNAKTQRLKTCPDHGPRPRYAILSDTWGYEEVTFQDVEAASPPTHKLSYQKVMGTCRRALEMGLSYVWVDTCCIDKTNPTELSIAINSMYQWYQDANVCFAYLSDVPFIPNDKDSQERRFTESRWFQRG